MMVRWVQEFCDASDSLHYVMDEKIEVIRGMDRIVVNTIGMIDNDHCPSDTSYFSLETKRYCKNLSHLERDFVRFLYGNKARFLPAEVL
jgi:hypothetical protein